MIDKNIIFLVSEHKNGLQRGFTLFIAENVEKAKLIFENLYLKDRDFANFKLWKVGYIKRDLNIEEINKVLITGGYEQKHKIEETFEQKRLKTKEEITRIKKN